jgi:hypothetical protein
MVGSGRARRRMVGTAIRVVAFLAIIGPTISGLPDIGRAEEEAGVLPYSLSIRTNQGWGLSHDGYTTLGGVLGIPIGGGGTYENGLPFLDLRGHIENDGGYALTSNLGYRWADWDDFRLYGFHAGFDWRDNEGHIDTSWINLGVETLGYDWDLRIDGYIPVGDSTDVECVCLDEFEGNEGILDYETFVGMGGIEGEFAINNNRGNWGIFGEMPSTAALRLHWFEGEEGDPAAGGSVRLELEPMRSVFVQGEFGYDSLFGTLATIRIGLRLWDSGASDERPFKLQERFVEPIERQELVIGSVQHIDRTFIDPATGLPVPFYHVDNTFDAGGIGSFEDRFRSLAEAEAATPQSSIVVVYEGDGTSNFYDTGIDLKDRQVYLGEGFAGTLDIFEAQICYVGGGRPTVTNSIDSAAINLADDNLVAGFDIVVNHLDPVGPEEFREGIRGVGVTNGTILGNRFLSTAQPRGTQQNEEDGIELIDSFGTFVIAENDFELVPDEAIHIDQGGVTSANYIIRDNEITPGEEGILIIGSGTSHATASIFDNDIHNAGQTSTAQAGGIVIDATEHTLIELDVHDNVIRDAFSRASGAVQVTAIQLPALGGVPATVRMRFVDNLITGYDNPTQGSGMFAITGGGGQIFLDMTGNSITNVLGPELYVGTLPTGGSVCANVDANATDGSIEAGTGVTPFVAFTGPVQLEPSTGNSGAFNTGAGVVNVADGFCGF